MIKYTCFLLCLLIFCINTNANTNDNDNSYRPFKECVGTNETVRNILMEFYNATNGNNWDCNWYTWPGSCRMYNSTCKWTSGDNYCDWYGIQCKDIMNSKNCDEIVEFDLSSCNLEGYVPESLTLLPNKIMIFGLSNNVNLTGKLPSTLFTNMEQLEYVDITSTGLYGDLPDFTPSCKLEYLSIGFSEFNTLDVSNCTNLIKIILNRTPISSFPYRTPNTQIITYPYLTTFIDEIGNLNNNGLNMQFFCHQPNLYWLDLSNNHYVGDIPECLGNLSKLEGLILANNKFISFKYGQYGEYDQYQSLTTLNLAHNDIEGIPENYYFQSLSTCILSYNRFTGYIPMYMSSNLTVLRVDNNPMIGTLLGYEALISILDIRNTNVIIDDYYYKTYYKIDYDTLSKDTILYQYYCPSLTTSYYKPTPLTVYVSSTFFGNYTDICIKI